MTSRIPVSYVPHLTLRVSNTKAFYPMRTFTLKCPNTSVTATIGLFKNIFSFICVEKDETFLFSKGTNEV